MFATTPVVILVVLAALVVLILVLLYGILSNAPDNRRYTDPDEAYEDVDRSGKQRAAEHSWAEAKAQDLYKKGF
jgi:hypothetical protein